MLTKVLFAILLTAMLHFAAAENSTSQFSGDLEGWGNWKSENAVVEFLHDPGVGHKAPGSLSIKLGPDNPEGKTGCFTRHFAVQPGQTCTGLVYVKTKDVAPAALISLGFQGLDEKGNFLGTGVQSTHANGHHFRSGEWKRLVYTIRIPDTGDWQRAGRLLCTLGIKNSPSGQIWFDDFQFFPAP